MVVEILTEVRIGFPGDGWNWRRKDEYDSTGLSQSRCGCGGRNIGRLSKIEENLLL